MVSQEDIRKASNRIVERFQPHRIILLGSYARGNADDRSDVDLLVVCPIQGSRRKLMVEIDRALRGVGFARDIIVLTPEEFERDRQIPGTIARPAWKEGKVLYEQA
jgi:predicted nucleotidyltransferase